MSTGEEYLDSIKVELEQGRRQWKLGYKVLEAFGYTRRRQTAIDLINDLLAKKGLSTDPVLTTEMPLDRGITFYLASRKSARTRRGRTAADSAASDLGDAPSADPAERSFIVGNLACAEREPVRISPSAMIEEALTKMALRDYSQLVVSNGLRDIKGIVSYKSVAQAFLHGNPQRVSDCIDRTVPIVELSESLLKVVALFQEFDAVLVIGRDRGLSGIVTASDISAEFGDLAAPFLLIGQIEEQLRWLVVTKLPDLTSALGKVGAGEFAAGVSVSDLTMGEIHRILDHDDHWRKVGIRFDRKEFCAELNAVREIRNAVMHFRDMPDDGTERLKKFAAVVQTAYTASTKR